MLLANSLVQVILWHVPMTSQAAAFHSICCASPHRSSWAISSSSSTTLRRKTINKSAGRLPEYFKFIEAETPRLCRKRKTKGKIRFLRSHSIRNFFDVSSVILIKKNTVDITSTVPSFWRRRRDSNPWYPYEVYTISNRARSTNYATSPRLLKKHIIWTCQLEHYNSRGC